MFYTVAEIAKLQKFDTDQGLAFLDFMETNYEARALTLYNPETSTDQMTSRLVNKKNVHTLLCMFFVPSDLTNTREYFDSQREDLVEAAATYFYDMVRITCIEMHIDDPETCPPDNAVQMVDRGWFNDMWGDELLGLIVKRVESKFAK